MSVWAAFALGFGMACLSIAAALVVIAMRADDSDLAGVALEDRDDWFRGL